MRIEWENLTCWRRLCVDGLSHRILLHFTWTWFLFLCVALLLLTRFSMNLLHERQIQLLIQLLCISVWFFLFACCNLPSTYHKHRFIQFFFSVYVLLRFFPLSFIGFFSYSAIYRVCNIDTHYRFCGHWEFYAWKLQIEWMVYFMEYWKTTSFVESSGKKSHLQFCEQ